MSAALHLADRCKVALVTKHELLDGASSWAQGGIAAVMDKGDSFDAHVDDTLVAGAGLSDPAATRFVVEHAPESVAWLQSLGVPFTEEDGHLHLTREGGHSARRIVHVTDATGAAVQQTLIEHVRRTPNIALFEQHMLVDLITTRDLDKHHLDLRLGAFDAIFDLEDRLFDIASTQIRSQLHMRVDQDLFRRQVHCQKL
jgi:L-aspartate oxidase